MIVAILHWHQCCAWHIQKFNGRTVYSLNHLLLPNFLDFIGAARVISSLRCQGLKKFSRFVRYVGTRLEKINLKIVLFQPEDWYSIRLTDLKESGVLPNQISKPRLVQLLSEKYPDHPWKRSQLLHSIRGGQQQRLLRTVTSLFPVRLRSPLSFFLLPFSFPSPPPPNILLPGMTKAVGMTGHRNNKQCSKGSGNTKSPYQ